MNSSISVQERINGAFRKAVRAHDFSAAQILLESGAQIDEGPRDTKQVPLDAALDRKDIRAFTFLLENGADLFCRSHGNTFLSPALRILDLGADDELSIALNIRGTSGFLKCINSYYYSENYIFLALKTKDARLAPLLLENLSKVKLNSVWREVASYSDISLLPQFLERLNDAPLPTFFPELAMMWSLAFGHRKVTLALSAVGHIIEKSWHNMSDKDRGQAFRSAFLQSKNYTKFLNRLNLTPSVEEWLRASFREQLKLCISNNSAIYSMLRFLKIDTSPGSVLWDNKGDLEFFGLAVCTGNVPLARAAMNASSANRRDLKLHPTFLTNSREDMCTLFETYSEHAEEKIFPMIDFMEELSVCPNWLDARADSVARSLMRLHPLALLKVQARQRSRIHSECLENTVASALSPPKPRL
jgi:hypothetical protein